MTKNIPLKQQAYQPKVRKIDKQEVSVLTHISSSVDTNVLFAGEDVQFTVQIEGEPDVSWYKGDMLLEDKGRYVIVDQDEDQIFTLAVEDVLPEDKGEYRCLAENEAGKSESVAKLFITEREYPPEFTNEGQDEPYFVKKGDDLTLNVAVKGKPLPEIQWFKDDNPLRKNIHYDISENGNEHSLCICSITLDDRGVYKCEATSKLGKASRKFQVNIEGMTSEIFPSVYS